jgi:hypothetical protein
MEGCNQRLEYRVTDLYSRGELLQKPLKRSACKERRMLQLREVSLWLDRVYA